MADLPQIPNIPVYAHPKGIGYFHPSLNMNPYKAAGLLNKAARMHQKGKKGGKVGRGPARLGKATDGRGAKVFAKGKR